MASIRDPDPPVANPVFLCGGIILDGDEDAQVVVWEDGAPTQWALQWSKWRAYFNIPDEEVQSTSRSPQSQPPALGHTEPSILSSQGLEMNEQDAGLELN